MRRRKRVMDDPHLPIWWWAALLIGLGLWAAVIYVAVHFISRWW